MTGIVITAKKQVKEGEDRGKVMLKLAKMMPSLTTQQRQTHFMGNIGGALTDRNWCLVNNPYLYKIDDYAETPGIYGLLIFPINSFGRNMLFQMILLERRSMIQTGHQYHNFNRWILIL